MHLWIWIHCKQKHGSYDRWDGYCGACRICFQFIKKTQRSNWHKYRYGGVNVQEEVIGENRLNPSSIHKVLRNTD